MSLPSEEKIAEYYALARILGCQLSFDAFKSEFEKHMKDASSKSEKRQTTIIKGGVL